MITFTESRRQNLSACTTLLKEHSTIVLMNRVISSLTYLISTRNSSERTPHLLRARDKRSPLRSAQSTPSFWYFRHQAIQAQHFAPVNWSGAGESSVIACPDVATKSSVFVMRPFGTVGGCNAPPPSTSFFSRCTVFKCRLDERHQSVNISICVPHLVKSLGHPNASSIPTGSAALLYRFVLRPKKKKKTSESRAGLLWTVHSRERENMIPLAWASQILLVEKYLQQGLVNRWEVFHRKVLPEKDAYQRWDCRVSSGPSITTTARTTTATRLIRTSHSAVSCPENDWTCRKLRHLTRPIDNLFDSKCSEVTHLNKQLRFEHNEFIMHQSFIFKNGQQCWSQMRLMFSEDDSCIQIRHTINTSCSCRQDPTERAHCSGQWAV